MEKCFISSDVRVEPASLAGYTPATVIRSMTTAWLHLATDVINSYNAMVTKLDPYVRFIARMPKIDGPAWVRSFKRWIETETFPTLCTVCDECRSALQHGRPCTIPGVWLPYVGGFGFRYCAECAFTADSPDAFKVESNLTGDFLALFTFIRKAPVTHASHNSDAAIAWSAFEAEPNPVYVQEDLLALKQVLSEWLVDYDPKVYPCHHGPGSTAEGFTERLEKYNRLTVPRKVREWCARRGVRLDNTIGGSGPCYSRVLFVPKTWKGPRVISAEPVGVQWAQQGIKDALYAYINAHKLLRRRIVLPDQSVNQSMAIKGSSDGSLATLDLSAASDSVTTELVTAVFPNRVLDDLLSTRTEYSLLNGRIYRIRKFAPMGSAVCFPVESLIFGAACEVICRQQGHGVWYTYGDDIIISSDNAEPLTLLLERLGFTVNIEKSFTTGYYRESCGVEALYGSVVTPIYYRVPGNILGTIIDPQSFQSAVGLVNQCYLRFPNLRKFLISRLHHMRCKVGRDRTRPLRPGWTDNFLDQSMIQTWNPETRKLRFRLVGDCQKGNVFHLPEVYADRVVSKAPPSSSSSRNAQPVYDWLAKREFSACGYDSRGSDLYSYQKLRRPALRAAWVWLFGEEHCST